MALECTLCKGTALNPVSQDYFNCESCDLIFLNPKKFLGLEAEKSRYLLHQGQNVEGHLKFLEPVKDYIFKNCDANISILDYGCGPDQVLSKHLKLNGFTVTPYDPIFYPQGLGPLQNDEKFDLIVSTEVFEHFYNPHEEIKRLISSLKKSGKILIMTSFHQGVFHFETWSYRRDPTHVVFYSLKTFEWISSRYGLVIEKFEMPNFLVWRMT